MNSVLPHNTSNDYMLPDDSDFSYLTSSLEFSDYECPLDKSMLLEDIDQHLSQPSFPSSQLYSPSAHFGFMNEMQNPQRLACHISSGSLFDFDYSQDSMSISPATSDLVPSLFSSSTGYDSSTGNNSPSPVTPTFALNSKMGMGQQQQNFTTQFTYKQGQVINPDDIIPALRGNTSPKEQQYILPSCTSNINNLTPATTPNESALHQHQDGGGGAGKTPFRKQSESRLSLPSLYARMGLANDHVLAREREQRVLHILQREGFKLGERTWIRDTTEKERKRIIDCIWNETFDDYGYGRELLEVIVRRGSYYLMQGRLRRIRRGRRAMLKARGMVEEEL